jgi:PAT family beta-lactamase induction signal transducer AmpG
MNSPLSSAHRIAAVLFLGFASGLPLALTGQAMQAWLTVDGVDIATIGFLGLVGIPYTFKFLWAPLMDRFEPPLLGRRRGWLVLTQLGLAGALLALAATSPTEATRTFALLAVLVAFVSASQDVVVDAYRTDLLPPRERGLGSSVYVLGYRLAMIVSGGIAFIWVDPTQGGGWTWPEVYRFMAGVMVVAALLSVTLLPRLKFLSHLFSMVLSLLDKILELLLQQQQFQLFFDTDLSNIHTTGTNFSCSLDQY